MRPTKRFLIGAVVIALAVSYLVYAGIRETSLYYLNIDEFAAQRSSLVGKALRVSGRVQHGTVQWNARTLDLRFALGGFTENDGDVARDPLLVRYNGVLPDMFAEGRDVIVEGVYHPDKMFAARAILTSCPSKYEPEAPAS